MSQSYPSILYPNNIQNYNTPILPHIHDSAMSGNASDYQSNKVGGSRRRHRIYHKRRMSKKVRRNRRKRTQKRK